MFEQILRQLGWVDGRNLQIETRPPRAHRTSFMTSKLTLEAQSMITVDEVHDFGNRWFNTVMNGGSAADQAAFFLDPHSRIYVLSNGTTFNFEEHHKLHAQWTNELHRFGHFNLTPLNISPERVRATGTVYWQAEFAGRPAPNVIKAVVGEDWILERTPSGDLMFVLYMNTFHHTLPDSAPLDL